MSVVEPKPKVLQRPIRRKEKYLSEPIRFRVKTSKLPKRETTRATKS